MHLNKRQTKKNTITITIINTPELESLCSTLGKIINYAHKTDLKLHIPTYIAHIHIFCCLCIILMMRHEYGIKLWCAYLQFVLNGDNRA